MQKYLTKYNTIFTSIFLLFIFLSGLYLRIKCFAFNAPFWCTEVELGDCLVNSSYLDFFKGLDHVQVAPPFFLVICKFLLKIFYTDADISARDMILRIFPFFCSVLSIPFFMYLVHIVFKNKYITFALSALFCVSPFAVGYSAVFKQYSCEMLFSILILILFYEIDFEKMSVTKLAVFGLIAALSFWFSLSIGIILVSGFVFLAVKIILEKKFFMKKLMVFSAPIIISFLLFIPVLWNICSKNYSLMNYLWFEFHPEYTNVFNLYEYLSKIVELLTKNIVQSVPVYNLFTALCLIIFIFKNNYKNNLLFILPVFLTIIAQMFHYYNFFGRFILFLLPVFIIIFGCILSLLKFNKIVKTFIILSIICLVSRSVLVYNNSLTDRLFDYSPQSRQQVYDIEKNIKPSEFIIADSRSYYDGYLGYYFKNNDNVIVLTEGEKFDKGGRCSFHYGAVVFLNNLKKGRYYFFHPHPITEELSKFFKDNERFIVLKEYPSGLLYIEKIK